MGLYIDMEMPKNCAGCFLRVGQCSKRIYMENRPSDCPLNEVTEPHGRLIDADAMIRDIEKSLAPNWYIKERNADMVKFLSLEDTVIPASESKERPVFLPQYELTPPKTDGDRNRRAK